MKELIEVCAWWLAALAVFAVLLYVPFLPYNYGPMEMVERLLFYILFSAICSLLGNIAATKTSVYVHLGDAK